MSAPYKVASAGQWSVWEGPDGNRIPLCTIITTTANDLLAPIHHRMSVILPKAMEGFWLDRSIDDPGVLGSLLIPHPDDAMELYQVSTLVNYTANDGPDIIEPVA